MPLAAVVLVHSFATRRIDHCCAVLAGLPSGIKGRLDQILQSAVRPISRIPKLCLNFCLHAWYSALASSLTKNFLKHCTTCLAMPHWYHSSYLSDLYRPVSDLPSSCLALCSSALGELLVPQAHSSLKPRGAFSVIGSSTWNGIRLTLHLLSCNNLSSVYRPKTS